VRWGKRRGVEAWRANGDFGHDERAATGCTLPRKEFMGPLSFIKASHVRDCLFNEEKRLTMLQRGNAC